MMQQWRVSKYDPAHRDSRGWYLKDEWTSVSDIGRTFADGVLTLESYLEAESRYLTFVHRLMNALSVPHMMVRRAGRHRSESRVGPGLPLRLRNKDVLSRPQVIEAIRDSLRDRFWCQLVYKRRLWMEVGFDFYLHFACDQLDLEELRILAGNVLDVQPFPWIEPIRE